MRVVTLATLAAAIVMAQAPIRLHPVNPHYFLFRGKPAVLIGSGEHYGAVLNQDFDYLTYLDTIHAAGLNFTKIINGSYREDRSSPFTPWAGPQNTLAPRPERYLAPWARSSIPAPRGGGNKFDFDRWDDKYFRRLADFVREAGRRGIVVEVALLTINRSTEEWLNSPFEASNNVNGFGATYWGMVPTLTNPALNERQIELVRKTVAVLREFGNVFFEICDECYAGRPPQAVAEWQERLAAEAAAVSRAHMIALSSGTLGARAPKPSGAISVLNFRYALPETASLNYGLDRAIAFDGTIEGTLAEDRRREAWAFLFSGGGLYNNVDWSFATGDPTGSGKVEQPGGRYDGREVRVQLKALREFMETIDYVHMRPVKASAATSPRGARVYLLEGRGSYAVYLDGGLPGRTASFSLDASPGAYRAEWILPRTGAVVQQTELRVGGSGLGLDSPSLASPDIAVRLHRIP